METPPTPPNPTAPGRRHAITALILFSPAILILVLAGADKIDNAFSVIAVGIAGPLIAGMIAGRRWAESLSDPARPSAGKLLLFIPLGIIASFVTCFFGCAFGGALR